MRKNPNVTPAKKAGTVKMGDAKPDANMPANNSGTFPVKLGSGQPSKFGKSVGPGKAQQAVKQSKTGGTANMPAANGSSKNVALGTTKHGVGQVPGYLRGISKSSYN